ncbi:MAG: hypothetical protein KDD82_27535 [Planctomycetes bacterium]|nr:hypothetical protein [Planctomycetota bacterium]
MKAQPLRARSAPDLHRFNAAERAVIERHRTPYQVQQFLNALPYNAEPDGDTLRSFRGVIERGTAHCLEAALTAAVILEHHGYPPLLLDLASQDGLDHVLFLYRKGRRWGTVSRSRDPGLHGRKPVFSSLRALVDSYFEPYIDCSGRILGYGVADLQDLDPYPWRSSVKNVWRVERFLIELPHTPFHGSDRRYARWHSRYLAYRRRFPERKPIYYPGRRAWTAGYPKR